jgi:hypothetical protein
MWNTELDDPRITEMDPVRKIWMYENWQADQIDNAELAKNHAYLLASFWNPEAVKQILGENTITSTEEELDETSEMIRNINLKSLNENKSPRRRKRGVLKNEELK